MHARVSATCLATNSTVDLPQEASGEQLKNSVSSKTLAVTMTHHTLGTDNLRTWPGALWKALAAHVWEHPGFLCRGSILWTSPPELGWSPPQCWQCLWDSPAKFYCSTESLNFKTRRKRPTSPSSLKGSHWSHNTGNRLSKSAALLPGLSLQVKLQAETTWWYRIFSIIDCMISDVWAAISVKSRPSNMLAMSLINACGSCKRGKFWKCNEIMII